MKTRQLVEGAMIAALFGLVSILNSYSAGMMDSLIGYFMVVPIAWYGYRYNLKDNMIVAFVSVLIVIFTGLPMFIFIAIYSSMFGLFLGESLKRKLKKEWILLGGFIVSFIANIMLYEVLSGLFGIDLIAQLTQSYKNAIEFWPSLKKHISLSQVKNMIPLFILGVSFMECYVMLALTQIILMRFHIPFPESFHLSTFRLSRKAGLVCAILLAVSFLLRSNGMKNIFVNYTYYLTYMIFVVAGLSYFSFFFVLQGKPGASALLILLLIIPITPILYAIVGGIDTITQRKNTIYDEIMKNANHGDVKE